MKTLVLIKLGGSLITDKSKPYTVRKDVITKLVQEIKETLQKRPELHLIIGNGAGSFGHQSAKKYDTKNGFTDETGKFGCCVVQNDVAKLNRIIVDEFIKQKLPAIGFQPSAVLIAKNKKPHYENFFVLKHFVDKGIIPVVYGDIILDQITGSTIFSTDKIIDLIAIEFKQTYKYEIESILSVGNYDGVVDNKKQVIPLITSRNFSRMKKYFFENGVVDVTGGMEAKVRELLAIAKNGCKSIIMNGATQNNLLNALLGEKVKGTVIR